MKVFRYCTQAKNIWLHISFVIICAVLYPTIAAEAKTENSSAALANRISGFVFDPSRTPISNLYVELQNEINQVVSRTKTDGGGRYTFFGMSGGTFYIRVLTAGTEYIEQSVRIQVVNFGSRDGTTGQSDNVTQDIYLQVPKKSSEVNFAPGVIFAQSIPKQAEADYNAAIASFDKADYPTAEKFLLSALNIYPDYFLARNRLGYLYFTQQSYEPASAQFAAAAEINPRSEATIYVLAYSVFLTKRYETTIEILRRALGYGHLNSRIYLLMGKSFRAIKKYESAELALKKAEEIDFLKTSDIHWELALLYGKNLGKYKEAADHLELFLQLQPDSADKSQIEVLIKSYRQKVK